MPQLMPLNWMMSCLMMIMLMFMLLKFFNLSILLMKKESKLNKSMIYWMW